MVFGESPEGRPEILLQYVKIFAEDVFEGAFGCYQFGPVDYFIEIVQEVRASQGGSDVSVIPVGKTVVDAGQHFCC